MKLLNLVYEKDWSIKEGELVKDEYSCVNIVFLFGDTDAIKDENLNNKFYILVEEVISNITLEIIKLLLCITIFIFIRYSCFVIPIHKIK